VAFVACNLQAVEVGIKALVVAGEAMQFDMRRPDQCGAGCTQVGNVFGVLRDDTFDDRTVKRHHHSTSDRLGTVIGFNDSKPPRHAASVSTL
jgi:hypothetical protein